jgi:hypothetical protein
MRLVGRCSRSVPWRPWRYPRRRCVELEDRGRGLVDGNTNALHRVAAAKNRAKTRALRSSMTPRPYACCTPGVMRRIVPLSWTVLLACAKGVPTGNETSATFGSPVPSDDDDDGGNSSGDGGTSIDTGTSSGEPSTADGSTDGDTSTSGAPGSSSGESEGSEASTAASPVCGDAAVDEGEDCDGSVAGLTCADADPIFVGGRLACTGSCTFDTSACTESETTTVCRSIALGIVDVGAVQDSLTVDASEAFGNIIDVNVSVELDHSYIGDLVIQVAHLGSTTQLFGALCAGQDNMNVTYDDEAGGAFDCPASDSGGSYTSAQPLATFDGAAAGGTWTLTVADQAEEDVGTIHEWCVVVTWG